MKATELRHNDLYKAGDKVVRYNALNGLLYDTDGRFFGKLFADQISGELSAFTPSGQWYALEPPQTPQAYADDPVLRMRLGHLCADCKSVRMDGGTIIGCALYDTPQKHCDALRYYSAGWRDAKGRSKGVRIPSHVESSTVGYHTRRLDFRREHKVGEIVKLPDGRRAEVVEVPIINECASCVFASEELRCDSERAVGLKGPCSTLYRSDGKNIIYKEIEEE